MKELMKIVPDEEEVAIDVIPLATKPPSIIDWKLIKEGKISYFQIIRANECSKRYLAFIQMLKSFDKEDLETMWKLVKAKHGFQNLHVFMLKEKIYPFTPATITYMLNKKLQADHWNEMCYQRIVGIKRLFDVLRVTAIKLMLLVYKLLLLVQSNVAGTKLQLLKD
ncbi:hypothetical protein Tco_0971469 [Tanacetum coccineum]